MVSPDVWIENGTVEVTNGVVTAVDRAGSECLDHGPGVIMPALVNAHAHLSLSVLAGRINVERGFVQWVQELIAMRASISDRDMESEALRSSRSVKASGTGLIAEVGPIEPGTAVIRAANLEGVVFAELLGNPDYVLPLPDDSDGVIFSYAGHALHTTHPAVLRTLKDVASVRNRSFSMHLAESEAESEFLLDQQGAWAELLATRGIDCRTWDLQSERPVQRAERLGLLGPGTLAVHVLQATDSDLETLASTRTSVCLCPRSNSVLHGRLPEIQAFLDRGMTPALGTDSLASAPSLSLFDEMEFVARKYPELRPEAILALATANGAQALGRTDLGTLEPGNRARLIYVELAADCKKDAAAQLVSAKPNNVEWL
jgi:aminodeoxyfutalosine deaminase